jgi:hypothetical protein
MKNKFYVYILLNFNLVLHYYNSNVLLNFNFIIINTDY